MARLYKTIQTDKEVKDYLQPFVDRGLVIIVDRVDGGLDIDPNTPSFYTDTTELSKIKYRLMSNGFLSHIGVWSRFKVSEPIDRNDFIPQRIMSDEFFNELERKVHADGIIIPRELCLREVFTAMARIEK